MPEMPLLNGNKNALHVSCMEDIYFFVQNAVCLVSTVQCTVHVHHEILNELMLSLNPEHSPIRERKKSNDIEPNEEYLFGWCVGGATKTFGSVPVGRECK